MSKKTPGRAAYDAWWATAEGVPATPDVTYDQDADAWEAAAEAGSGKLRAELAEVNGYHAELLNEVLLNAGDEFGTDDAADVIAVRYVRHLEAERDRLYRLLAEAVDPTAQDYDNAAEILRLRDALADAEAQSARWTADAASWERRADELDGTIADYRDALTAMQRERDEARAERDGVYGERAALVAFLAACYPSVITKCPEEPDWPIVYVSTPDGQMSWHIATDDLHLLGAVPEGRTEWDGHDTPEKYRRLASLVRTLVYTGPPAQVDASAAERERDEARAVVREMLAHWERIGTTREEDELMPEWRERAGIEAQS